MDSTPKLTMMKMEELIFIVPLSVLIMGSYYIYRKAKVDTKK